MCKFKTTFLIVLSLWCWVTPAAMASKQDYLHDIDGLIQTRIAYLKTLQAIGDTVKQQYADLFDKLN